MESVGRVAKLEAVPGQGDLEEADNKKRLGAIINKRYMVLLLQSFLQYRVFLSFL